MSSEKHGLGRKVGLGSSLATSVNGHETLLIHEIGLDETLDVTVITISIALHFISLSHSLERIPMSSAASSHQGPLVPSSLHSLEHRSAQVPRSGLSQHSLLLKIKFSLPSERAAPL